MTVTELNIPFILMLVIYWDFYLESRMKLSNEPHVAHELWVGQPSAIVFSVSTK